MHAGGIKKKIDLREKMSEEEWEMVDLDTVATNTQLRKQLEKQKILNTLHCHFAGSQTLKAVPHYQMAEQQRPLDDRLR